MGEKRNECAFGLHIAIVTVLFVAAGILLGLSIYTVVRGDGGLFELNYTGTNFLNTVLNLGIVGIIAGAAMLILALIGLVASAKGGCGIFLKIIYIALGIIAVCALIGVAVVLIWFTAGTNPREVEDFFRDAWKDTVNDPSFSESACNIQRNYECQGFDNGDCNSCDADGCGAGSQVCPTGCEGFAYESGRPGCWEAVHDDLSKFYLPVGIVSASLAGLTLIDIFLVCLV
mmetsp:Transcript_39011/g.95419  ORF Transcript_39011/g.95419 Transcript_39011/m.95419 type:complete len:230 (+) Transcript_39011:103-792(+)